MNSVLNIRLHYQLPIFLFLVAFLCTISVDADSFEVLDHDSTNVTTNKIFSKLTNQTQAEIISSSSSFNKNYQSELLPNTNGHFAVKILTSVIGTQTFSYTGTVQAFTVPAGVTEVTIEAYGAQGKTSSTGSATGGTGGKGGYIKVDPYGPVNPGQKLYVYVGGQMGWNGGADGVTGVGKGGQGGDASDVRTVNGSSTANLNTRIVVAGGGGGAGWDTVVNNECKPPYFCKY